MPDFVSWLNSVTFRLRLLRVALSPMSRIPAGLAIALNSPNYEYSHSSDEPTAVR